MTGFTGESKPIATPGRIVRFQSPDGERVAVITGLNPDGGVDLCVLETTHPNRTMGGPEGNHVVDGCWNWPQRASQAPQ